MIYRFNKILGVCVQELWLLPWLAGLGMLASSAQLLFTKKSQHHTKMKLLGWLKKEGTQLNSTQLMQLQLQLQEDMFVHFANTKNRNTFLLKTNMFPTNKYVPKKKQLFDNRQYEKNSIFEKKQLKENFCVQELDFCSGKIGKV